MSLTVPQIQKTKIPAKSVDKSELRAGISLKIKLYAIQLCWFFIVEHKKEFSAAVAPGHWQEASNRRQYMEWLGNKLGYTTWEDWYQIDSNSFLHHHGSGLLLHSFNNSPSAAVVDSFPEHKWVRFMFRVVPHGHWEEKANQRRYLDWLGTHLGFSSWEDWYKIDNVSFLKNHGAGFLKKFGNSPRAAVTAVYPEHSWIPSKFVGKINLLYRVGKKVNSVTYSS